MAEDDLDLDSLDPAEPENWKRLRDYALRQQRAASEADQVRRENAFLRAGIDLSTRLGQAFAQTYSGKLDDVEAIRADAKDFDPRIVANASDAGTTGGEGQTQEGQTTTEQGQTTGSSERSALADGATSPGAEHQNVAKASVDRAKQLLDDGKQWEVAAGEMVAQRSRALADNQFQQSIDPVSGIRRRG